MVQVLQRGRLNQAAVHNLDMHMCFQFKFWSWYNAIMKTTFHIMEIMLSTWQWKQPLHSRLIIVREVRMASRLHSSKLIIFITRWNLKTMMSILIFTFYIIN